MTLAYVMDGGAVNDPPDPAVSLYERFPPVRRLFADAARWAEVDVGRLLRQELTGTREYRQAGAIRQAIAVLAVCDLLAERGVRPDLVAGISLGGMVGASVAGAVDRSDLFGLLGHMRKVPDPPGPPQGMATCTVPPGADVAEYLAPAGADVHVAVDGGPVPGGNGRQVILSGHLSALRELQRRLPTGLLMVLQGFTAALHSPFMRHMEAFVTPFITRMTFADPVVPLCSCYEPTLLTDADQVRDMFLRLPVGQASYPHLYTALIERGTDLAILAGPGSADRFRRALPSPVVQARTPDDVPDAVTALQEATPSAGRAARPGP